MGNQQHKHQKTIDQFIQENPQKILEFQIKVSNVSTRGVKKLGTFYTIKIGKNPKHTSKIRYNQNPQWNEEYEINYETQIGNLEQNYLEFKLRNSKNHKKIGQLKISLYEICNAPVHLDYKLGKKERVYMDIQMSQFVDINIQAKNINVNMMKEIRAVEYFFTMSLIQQNQQKFESDLSDVFKNDIPNMPTYYHKSNNENEQSFEIKEEQHLTTRLSINGNNLIREPSNIFQNEETEKLYNDFTTQKFKQLSEYEENLKNKTLKWNESPKLQVKILISELPKINFKISIWKNIGSENNRQIILRGEAFFFIHKLIMQSKQEEIQKNYYYKHQTQTKEVFLSGKKQGEINVELEAYHEKFYHQKVAGVYTEDGFIYNSPIILPRKEKIHPQIQILRKYFEELQQMVIREDKFQDGQSFSQQEKQIKQNLDLLNKLLKRSEKISTKSFTYNNEEEIMEFQSYLLNYLELMLLFYDQVNEQIEKSYFDCLRSLIERGELSLQYIKLNDIDENLKDQKTKIALLFQKLMYDILQKVLENLTQKGLFIEQKNFMVFFLAYSYFSIPQFRSELLKVIKYKMDKHKSMDNEVFIIFFSWTRDFYDIIQNEEQSEMNIRILQQALDSNWRKKFEKRTQIFFYFIIQWIEYLKKRLIVNKISWVSIPGYSNILNLFIQDVEKNLKNHRYLIQKAGSVLLQNHANLNIFTTSLIHVTNLEDHDDITHCIKTLNYWFKSYIEKEKEQSLPHDLNLQLLLLMTIYIFNSQDSLSIANILSLWYQNFPYINYQSQNQFIEILIRYFFFEFFLHWSINIRSQFIYFLVYSISYLYQIAKQDQKSHLEYLMSIIEGNISFCKLGSEVYQREFKAWAGKDRMYQRKIPLIKVQIKVVTQITEIYKKNKNFEHFYEDLDTTNINIQRDQKQSDNIVKDIILEVEHFFESQGKEKISKYKAIFDQQELKKSKITINNLTYCNKSVKHFQTIQKNFEKEKKIVFQSKKFPLFEFIVTKDNYEAVQNEEEFDWQFNLNKKYFFFKQKLIFQFKFIIQNFLYHHHQK